MQTKIKLKIADTVIRMQSDFPLEQMTEEEKKSQLSERYDSFSYTGRARPDILIEVNIVNSLPEIRGAKPLFVTYHFQDSKENWRILKKGKVYIYKCPLQNKKQVMLVNEAFDRVTAYLLPKVGKGRVWGVSDLIYDFLQVLLINYFARHKKGVFVHSSGVKDVDGGGLLFAGKSGAGKSTTARLWHQHSKAMVLNDDRVIARKAKGKFFIYGSPWHGAFSDYLASRIESAELGKLFFIHHSSGNVARRVSSLEAFKLLYPAIFPTFWDESSLENIVSFCHDLVNTVPCYTLGFVKEKRAISFVRKVR